MVKISFLGSCREIGRSSILVESKNGIQCMLDYGIAFNNDDRLPYETDINNLKAIALTHCHIDHIPLAHKFRNAKFLVQQAELDYHRNPSPAPVDPRPCPKELLDTLNWEVVNGDYQIEEGLKVLFTPGHTPGGQSVAVDTAKGVAVIDSLCTTDANWNVPPSLAERMEILCPGVHSDPVQAYESLIKVKEMADIRVPIHEPRFAWIDRIPD